VEFAEILRIFVHEKDCRWTVQLRFKRETLSKFFSLAHGRISFSPRARECKKYLQYGNAPKRALKKCRAGLLLIVQMHNTSRRSRVFKKV
jgi:hypothetical protein